MSNADAVVQFVIDAEADAGENPKRILIFWVLLFKY